MSDRLRRVNGPAERLGVVAVLSVVVLGPAGCEMDSFLDPSVVGRWERTPVTLPILDRLDIIDEPSTRAPGTTGVQVEDLSASAQEYVLGTGDVVTFSIFELVEANRESVQTRRVDELGVVRLPTLGAIEVGGLTPTQAEERIKETLQQRGILRDPQVHVIVQEGRQRTFSVIGEPSIASTSIGTYVIPNNNFRLLEAMALARGVPGRTKTLYIIRQTPVPAEDGEAPAPDEAAAAAPAARPPQPRDPGALIDDLMRDQSSAAIRTGQWRNVNNQWVRVDQPEDAGVETVDAAGQRVRQRIIEIPFQRLLEGDMRYNVVIRPGDIIRVPAPVVGNIYIGGAINRPGTYALPGDKDLTLKQLVFAAGNLSPLAMPERVDLIRRVGDDQEATVRLNLKAIFHGTEPDFYLKSSDTINVGTSFVAPPLAVLRNGFRTTYGFGFLLDRNFGSDVFGPTRIND